MTHTSQKLVQPGKVQTSAEQPTLRLTGPSPRQQGRYCELYLPGTAPGKKAASLLHGSGRKTAFVLCIRQRTGVVWDAGNRSQRCQKPLRHPLLSTSTLATGNAPAGKRCHAGWIPLRLGKSASKIPVRPDPQQLICLVCPRPRLAVSPPS